MSEPTTTQQGFAYLLRGGPHNGREGMIEGDWRTLALYVPGTTDLAEYGRDDCLCDGTLVFSFLGVK